MHDTYPIGIIVEHHLVPQQCLRSCLVISGPGQLDVAAPIELDALRRQKWLSKVCVPDKANLKS